MTRRTAFRILTLAGALLAGSDALALNPTLDISQYAHTSWKYRDGFTKGNIEAIAQTSDGYLWLGTAFGLYRFDGVRAVPWEPGAGQSLPSNEIGRLLAARDGTLWMGTRNGLASWKAGRLTQYPEMAGLSVTSLLEDRAGSIWVGTYGIPPGKLCEIREGSVRCHPEIAHLGRGVMGLQEDAKGYLWVGLKTGVERWKPGPPEFFEVTQPDGIQGMAGGEDGGLLISLRGAIARLRNGKPDPLFLLPANLRVSRANSVLRDRDGGLWGATLDAGIVHWHRGRTDVFSESDGLSGGAVSGLFEDGEGDVWAATVNGLDRFRELPAVTYSGKQGLSSVPGGAVLAAKDGSVWFASSGALNRLNHGQVTLYRGRSGPLAAGAREVVDGELPNPLLAALSEDSRGRIWLSSQAAIGYLENGRFLSAAAPGGVVPALSEDSAGNMWAAYQDLGLVRLSEHHEVQRIPWAAIGHRDPADALVPDPHGGLWLGFFGGGVAWFREGQVIASYSSANGLGRGRIYDLRFGKDGALWAGTDGGLSRLKDGRIATLSSASGLPCDAVQWSLEDDAQSVWVMMPCGLVRVARADLEEWNTTRDKAGFRIHPTVLDVSEGVMNRAGPGAQTPHAAKSLDGRLWFWNVDGLGMVDPRHLPYNKVPPPVQIEQITADRKTYDVASGPSLRLPALVRDLAIDYTALSFAAPEKMRFRYKLDGRDRGWVDAGNRRQAFYNDLPPRHYRFRVMAANNSGVWNEAGASLDFSVAPAYYQTGWFRALVAATILALLGGLYRLRLFYLERQFHIRFDERVNERMRLARDLHDTLLQSFQGVLLKFHAVTYRLPDRPDAKKELEAAIEQARKAIDEGRDAVQGLRSSVVVMNDLARAITTFGEGLASDQNGRQAPDFRVHVEGTTRDLVPLVRDEVYRIAGEALRNAFRHGDARRVEAEIHYDARQLRMRVRDDGKGIDPQVLGNGRRGGHHGLPGMRERADLVGGTLAVWSELHSGTEIELIIPGGIAYAKAQAIGAGGQGNLT